MVEGLREKEKVKEWEKERRRSGKERDYERKSERNTQEKLRGKSEWDMGKEGEVKEKNEDEGGEYTGYTGRGQK